MRLSVIIPAYEDVIGVLACLNSLRGNALEQHEYVVQDDCSPSVFFPAVIPPEIASCQRNAQNVGFGVNCNSGAIRSSGDVLFFVNQDVFCPDNGLSNGWDAHLLDAFKDPQVGIVGARLLFPNGSVQNAGGEFDAKCQPTHRYFGWANANDERVITSGPVDWTTGAALAVRRDVFEAVGGFDAAYRAYFEDVDLCMKVRSAGFHVWYAPACTLVHRVGSTGGSPHFGNSARTFYDRWVKTAAIKPGLTVVRERFW